MSRFAVRSATSAGSVSNTAISDVEEPATAAAAAAAAADVHPPRSQASDMGIDWYIDIKDNARGGEVIRGDPTVSLLESPRDYWSQQCW